MREIGKFCCIYCYEAHKTWQALLSHIQDWFNGRLSVSTGYSPSELIFDSPSLSCLKSCFRKGLNKNHVREPAGKGCKSTLEDEGEAVAYPGIFFGGWGVKQIQLRAEDREDGDLGAVAPLVRGSGGSCNLVQEISFHIVKFS